MNRLLTAAITAAMAATGLSTAAQADVAGQKLLESGTRGFRALEIVISVLVAQNLRSVSDQNLTFGTPAAYDRFRSNYGRSPLW